MALRSPLRLGPWPDVRQSSNCCSRLTLASTWPTNCPRIVLDTLCACNVGRNLRTLCRALRVGYYPKRRICRQSFGAKSPRRLAGRLVSGLSRRRLWVGVITLILCHTVSESCKLMAARTSETRRLDSPFRIFGFGMVAISQRSEVVFPAWAMGCGWHVVDPPLTIALRLMQLQRLLHLGAGCVW
jgi:hypothetical protein